MHSAIRAPESNVITPEYCRTLARHDARRNGAAQEALATLGADTY